MKTVALIAHDRKKQEIVEFARNHFEILSRYELIATKTTGNLLTQETGSAINTFLSGPMGGDIQIGAKIANQEVDLVIFLRDPLTAQPHEPDITALLRVCDVHNVPVATNLKGAHLLIINL